MTLPPLPPAACDVAFKEWAGVCHALSQGRQSLILRKGGIAEGTGGFTPEHSVFWLYPTHVHENQQGLRDNEPPPAPWGARDDAVPLQVLAAVESVDFVDRPELLPALEPLHVWTAETVLKRFHYRQPGLWVLSVRVWAGVAATFVPVTAAHLGCKTWVPLEAPVSTLGLAPVLDDSEAARRRERLAAALCKTY
ncbi:MAG: DUF1802 family protein [Isosphaeraceae bacterium]|nr:DUF1802 family protein [Isosphaeraceae bacterium]